MIRLLKPSYYYKNIFSIELDKLIESNIEGIICDIDNTIVPWSEERVLGETFNWFEKIKRMEFKVCLVSNGIDNRASFFGERLDLPYVGMAKKPSKSAFIKAMKILDLEANKIAVIGDQIFTDILGGNRMGFITILVDPMSERELFITRIMRFLEAMFFERGAK
jgi:uncharacterized protein